MTDFREKKTDYSQDSRTINIEIPDGSFEGMFRMMTGWRNTGRTGMGCCEMSLDRCCPRTAEDEGQEFRIVVKRRN